MSQQAAVPVGTEVGMSSADAPNASVGVPTGATAGVGSPMNGTPTTATSGIIGALGKLNSIASMFGKDPKEREANAKAFASMTKDVGNTVKDFTESSLLQRMMEHSMSGPSFLNPGQAPAGGVAAIPKTFDPSLASHIMNQMGYK